MRIALIQPAMGRSSDHFVTSWKMEPLALAVLAGHTPRGHELVLWDDRMERIPYDEPVDLVAISAETYTARRAYQIARRFRARGVPVVLGGYHPTLMPEEAQQHGDAILCGEAEALWPTLLRDAAAHQLRPIYRADERPVLGGVLPDRSLFAAKRYLPLTLVEAGRGCRHGCDFCSITAYYQHTFRARPPEEVAAEIAATGRRWIFLVDDNLAVDRERARALFRALKPLKISWVSQITIAAAEDEPLLDEMVESGCAGVLIGFESIEPANLAAMNKGFNRGLDSYRELLRRIRQRAIKIYATFVFGYDQDPPDIFRRTLDFALEQEFCLAAFNHLQPFPGTPLYRRLEEEGRLLYPRWWLQEGYHFGQIAFRPKHLAPEALFERLMELRREFYGVRGILRRARDWRTNLAGPGAGWLFTVSNLLLRRELVDKWATPLGDLREGEG